MKSTLKSIIIIIGILPVIFSCKKENSQSRIGTVAVTDVTLDKTTLNIAVGGTETLTATLSPDNATNKSVTWESSNSALATVDANGKIAAIKAGDATITVITKDGHKTASCAVTVTQSQSNIPVTGVFLSNSAVLNIEEPYISETLLAIVSPANATNKAITWASSAPDIVTVDEDGKIFPKKMGTAVVTATTVDRNKKASCTVDVYAWGSLSVGTGYLDLNWRLTTGGELSFSQGVIIPNFGENSAPWHKYRPFIKKVQIKEIKSIGNYAFYHCTDLWDVSLGTNGSVPTESIGNYAFSGCTALIEFSAPNTLKTIGLEAFSGCTVLQNIKMPSSGELTTIGNWAFANCIGLQVLNIPNSVKTIGIGAFNNCNKLINLTIGSGVTSIGEDAFRFCPKLKTVRCNTIFPPALGARNFDAVGDKLIVPYDSHDLYMLSSPNPTAWRAAFDNNIVY